MNFSLKKIFLCSSLSITAFINFFAKGAAAELPDPPCSTKTLNEYLGSL